MTKPPIAVITSVERRRRWSREDKERHLADNKIRLFDSAGNEIDPSTIAWHADKAPPLMFRQDPGKINAMGSVLFRDQPNPGAQVTSGTKDARIGDAGSQCYCHQWDQHREFPQAYGSNHGRDAIS